MLNVFLTTLQLYELNETVDLLCQALGCRVEDIMEYIPDPPADDDRENKEI